MTLPTTKVAKLNEVLSSEQLDIMAKITLKLAELGLAAEPLPNVAVGPILSVYRFRPMGTTKVRDLEALGQDMAVILGAPDVLIKRLPGETSVGFYVPNQQRSYVPFLKAVNFLFTPASDLMLLPLVIGVDHLGQPIVDDLSSLPHLLVAGSTGAGKSTWLAQAIAASVYKMNTNSLRLVMFDTKQTEFGYFVGAPHLLYEPARSIGQCVDQLEWLVEEVESRLKQIGKNRAHNIAEYNAAYPASALPRIVLVIDELADLLTNEQKGEGRRTLGSYMEGMIGTLAGRARAAGIHIIAATQRPSVDVVTGTIKANFPARLSFRLPSEFDSKTILNTNGAEHLLSPGDALYISPNRPGIIRVHAPEAKRSDITTAIEVACRRENQ